MIESIPRWTFASRNEVIQWYGHAHLLADRVLGQWCCLDRDTGRLIWQKKFWRPNSIHGVTESVIVASETRSDGPWTSNFGCYGICIKTGRLLWASHASGLCGLIVRILDYVPGFTNELRDAPHRISGNEVYCRSGRVVDLQTGTDVRRVSREEVGQFQKPRSEAERLYDGIVRNLRTRIMVSENRWLSHKKSDQDRPTGGFHLYLLDDNDTVLWEFDSDANGMHIASNFYSYRFVSHRFSAPYVHLVVSEKSNLRKDPTRADYWLQNPTRYHLLSVDLTKGLLVGDVLVDERKVNDCRIEDADERGVLVSLDRSILKYYQWSQITPQSLSPVPA